MTTIYDAVIIGAGPGGLAAAVQARSQGLSVLLLNEQTHLGGQIYHSLETVSGDKKQILGQDYLNGQSLLAEFKTSGAEYVPNVKVVSISKERSICYLDEDKITETQAKQLIISAGAMERPVPVPGWTLPGVMGAASVDILLKQSDIIPSGRVVFAGSGPLMLSVICHLIDSGVNVAAIIDTSAFKNKLAALAHAGGALSNPGLLFKGFGMMGKIKKAGILVVKSAGQIQAVGKDSVEAVLFKQNGKTRQIKTDLLLLHEGLIPDTQLSRLTGCDHEWVEGQRYFRPIVDDWNQSSVEGISLAGDCTGIFGAKTAEFSGRIAGINIAFKLGIISEEKRDKLALQYVSARKKELKIRSFIDAVYPPNKDQIIPNDPETMVCRCEEVTVSDILNAIRDGYTKPGTIKNKTRSGMGRCQGRMCGTIITQLLSENLMRPPGKIGYYHVRSMVKPVTLSQLGNMESKR